MSAFGLALLPLLAVLLITTGLPAYAVLILGAVLGATAGVATGVIPLVALNALPSRLIGLLESDLLQALPLFVLMGALLGRLNTAELLFRLIAAPLGDRPSAPKLATPERFRLMLTELGPTFVKLGQQLSLRADILPYEYTEELSKMLSEALNREDYEKAAKIRDELNKRNG